ncbi:MAG: DUF1730 domain-containing protein [Actinomycetota bacterium]|nr:DUF1730 domain-containing protein [Actinomycetota bacterium]MDA8207994.1 DUF1730 domain-containing protein [Actinomycetota bacterium]
MSLGRGLEAEIAERARAEGLVALAISRARTYRNVAVALGERDAAGLRDTMQFTYRNPARSTDPTATLPGARSVISASWPYGRSSLGQAPSVVARYARRDSYAELRRRLGALAEVLEASGHQARVVADSNALVDKEPAVRGGGGWYLKNSLYAVPVHGSMVVVGSVITDADLTPTRPRMRLTGCGGCTSCMTACPTGAILPGGTIDAGRCIAWQLQKPGMLAPGIAAAMGVRVYGCDICQEVCPYNRKVAESAADPLAQLGELVEILAMDDSEVLARFSHLYLPRRDPSVLRRNALAAIGNLGPGPALGPALALLAKWAENDDPVLAATAAGSLARLRASLDD